jgi:hypothetical protein
MRGLFAALLLVCALTLSGCSAAPPAVSDLKPKVPVSEGPSATQIANLTAVDASAPATGPSVHELITVDDVKKILGRDDIVFAEAL